MADPKRTEGEPPRWVHVERKKRPGWLLWALLAVALLALLFLLSRCDRQGTQTNTATGSAAGSAASVQRVTLPGGAAVDLQPNSLNYDLQRFLASDQPAPRTFTFEKLKFDSGSSEIRADDQPTLAALERILAAYPRVAVKLTGYADARGTDPANLELGKERAEAIARSLTSGGIAADRITAGSGGESNPVSTNASAHGRFENRRTELTVTSK